MNAFYGNWLTVEMEQWEPDEFNKVIPAKINFNHIKEKKSLGGLNFSNITANFDCRYKTVHKRPFVDFSFYGKNEKEPVVGRGFAILRSETMMEGTIILHQDIESWFVAKKYTDES